MPRKRREESTTGIYHWIVRGMNKKHLFHHGKDFQRFRELILEYKIIYSILVYHYCFMTNHVHMLIQTARLNQLAKFSHYVQRRYAYYYCGKYKWTGSVFQRGYRSIVIERDEYLLECGRYIERNPIKAKLAKAAGDYIYSSFDYYAKGNPDELLDVSPAYLGLSPDLTERKRIYADYVNQTRIQEEMAEKGLLPV